MGILWYNMTFLEYSWTGRGWEHLSGTIEGGCSIWRGWDYEVLRVSRPSWVWACHVDWKQPKVTMPWDQREVSHSSEPELWVWSGILEWDTYKHPISPRVQTLQTFGILESTTRCWELALFEIPPSVAKVATADKPPALLASVLAGMLNQTINGQTFCTSLVVYCTSMIKDSMTSTPIGYFICLLRSQFRGHVIWTYVEYDCTWSNMSIDISRFMQCPPSFHDPLRSFQRWICFVPLAARALGALACACPPQQNSTFIEEFNKGVLGLDGDADADDDDDGSLAIHRFLSGPFSGRSEKEPKAETQPKHACCISQLGLSSCQFHPISARIIADILMITIGFVTN